MLLCNLITPVCGATKLEAEDKMALIEKLPLEIEALSLLAEGLNFDFAAAIGHVAQGPAARSRNLFAETAIYDRGL